MLFSPQIPLPLEPSRVNRFEDFVAGPNAALLESLKAVPSEPGQQVFLSGPAASGKTHLLNAICLASREAGLSAFYAGLKSLPPGSESLLDDLERVDVVCIDDAQRIAGNGRWEEALFHCLNRIRASQGRIIFAAGQSLSALTFALPDLVSRLQWGLRLQLQPLDDRDKIRVVDRHAASLGIEIPPDVGSYLIKRGSRNMRHLLLAVDRLQHVAFTSKRRITIPLAREVLSLPGVD